jgi:RNA polymerase sigma-70 factor, ECF subfamily
VDSDLQRDALRQFEVVALPHLDAAYNLARWMTRNDFDAEDVVQDAMLRALRFIGGFHGRDSRAWLLAIVRNTCLSWLEKNRPAEIAHDFDETQVPEGVAQREAGPEANVERAQNRQALHLAIAELPIKLREVLILCELEELSYKEIARVVDIPIGTVMSRLSRARAQLERSTLLMPLGNQDNRGKPS